MSYIQEYLASMETRRFKLKKEEVAALLRQASADLAEQREMLLEKDAVIAALKEELRSLQDKNDSFQDILLSSEVLARQIVADAETEADEIIAKAHAEGERIANEYRTAVENESQELLSDTRRFKLELEEMCALAKDAKEQLHQAIPQI